MTLRELRKKQQITIGQIAEVTGLSVQCIYNYERGLREPSISTIYKLSEILAVSVDTLLECFKESRK